MRTFLVLVATASVASAIPKYSRKQDLHHDVKLAPRTRPAPPPERHTPEATTPAVDADDVLDIEDKAAPLRAEQQALLVQLVRDTPDTAPDKPDYLIRLAEQYALQLRHWRLRAVDSAMQRDLRRASIVGI